MTEEHERSVASVLIAHRGDCLRIPENTLLSLHAALRAGVRNVEFDVQVTADGVPVVIHDPELRRTAGVDGCVLDLRLDQLREVEVNERDRLGDAFCGVRIPMLQQAVELVRANRGRAFVHLKRASLRRFGTQPVLDAAVACLAPLAGNWVAVSSDIAALDAARARTGVPIGWVVRAWDGAARREADTLAADFLFLKHERLPQVGGLWPGPWRWVVYGAEDPEVALPLLERGIDLIETKAVAEFVRYLAPVGDGGGG